MNVNTEPVKIIILPAQECFANFPSNDSFALATQAKWAHKQNKTSQ